MASKRYIIKALTLGDIRLYVNVEKNMQKYNIERRINKKRIEKMSN